MRASFDENDIDDGDDCGLDEMRPRDLYILIRVFFQPPHPKVSLLKLKATEKR